MARKTAQEISKEIADRWGKEDGVESILEDIADSVGDVNLKDYVPKTDYEKMEAAAFQAQNDLSSMREKYINRFYSGYDKPNEKGYIMGQAAQGEIQEEEQKDWYSTLFE